MKKLLLGFLFFGITLFALTWGANAAEPLWNIDPSKTVLLVIDMQNGFIKEGACLEVPEARKQIPTVKELIDGARKSGVPVVYTGVYHKRDGSDVGLLRYWPVLPPKGTCFAEGTDDVQIHRELAPIGNEMIIWKHSYSAFYNTNLETILRNIRGPNVVDTLIICGTVTNICVESTARDAGFRDFKVVLAHDATSTLPEAVNPGAQKATEDILTIAFFARVMNVKDILEILKHGK